MNFGNKIIGLYGTEGELVRKVTKILTSLFKHTEVSLGEPLEKIANVVFGINLRDIYGEELSDKHFNYSPKQLFKVTGNTDIIDDVMLRLLSAKLDGAVRSVVVTGIGTRDEIKLVRLMGGQVYRVMSTEEYDDKTFDFDGRIVDFGSDDDLIYIIFRLIVGDDYDKFGL